MIIILESYFREIKLFAGSETKGSVRILIELVSYSNISEKRQISEV